MGGFKGDAISKVFESNSSGDRLVALFKSVGAGMNKESCEKFLNGLDEMDRFRFGVIISASSIQNLLHTDARQIFENCWKDVLNTPLEILELGEVQQMTQFFKKRNSDWRITEEARSVQAFLDKASLHLSIHSNSTEATQDNSKKRRM